MFRWSQDTSVEYEGVTLMWNFPPGGKIEGLLRVSNKNLTTSVLLDLSMRGWRYASHVSKYYPTLTTVRLDCHSQ